MLFRTFGHDISGYKTGGVEGDFGAWEGGKERAVAQRGVSGERACRVWKGCEERVVAR